MKLDDPELLRKPVPDRAIGPYTHEQIWRSLYCRNHRHDKCQLSGCLCECHTEASKQLALQLRSKGAIRIGADGFPRCYTQDCENRTEGTDTMFCPDCLKGRTPLVRARFPRNSGGIS